MIINATNISEGTTRYFTQGNLTEILIASSSIPIVFSPVNINGNFYVDGGVTNNFPVEPLKDICNEIIGVNVNPTGSFEVNEGIGKLAMHAFHLSIASGLDEKRKILKYFIEPAELKNYTYYDIKRGKEIYDIGYQTTIKVIGSN